MSMFINQSSLQQIPNMVSSNINYGAMSMAPPGNWATTTAAGLGDNKAI
jgi:hypothetical protein